MGDAVHCPELDPKLHSVILERSLAYLGLPITYSLIGGRTCGSAYLSGGRVYKVTTDKSEAIESNKIVGKTNQHLVNIYNVKKVNNTLTDVDVYLIVMEHLRTDRDAIFADIEEMLTHLFEEAFDKHFLDIVYYYRFSPDIYRNEYEQEVNAILSVHQREKYYYESLLKIADELRENGIESLDLQYHNLGLKPNGNLGFFDLGYGDTRGNVNAINVNERVMSYMKNSSAVGIAKKCKFGGNPDGTSNACNKGDISNITMKPIKEEKFYRVDSGFSPPRGTTALDVINFEANENGNTEEMQGALAIAKQHGIDLSKHPASKVMWVTKTPEHASRYGDEIDTYELNNPIVLADDGDNGYLVFLNEHTSRHNKIFQKKLNENTGREMISKLDTLSSYFAEAAQSVYDAWEQDEEGHDEMYGYGGICDDIADKMCDVVSQYTNYQCFTQYNEYECHTSIYVYDIEQKTLIFVDINPFHYETGGGYTWKKTPNVRFTPEMVSFEDRSGYWENFFDEENELRDLNEAKTIGLNELPFKQDVEQAGGKLYSVGGAVRDTILGKESKDLDILITGIPLDQLEQILSKYGKVDSVGKSFGIIKFNTPQTGEIDIAIPRTERKNDQGGYQGFDVTSDHSLPIEKDLERRDFTINAIAKDSSGLMIDPYGGQGDIEKKQIKMVNPQAFSDDPLRMLRAVQFAARFGFDIEPATLQAIQQNAAKIREISPERILIEFDKIVKKGNQMVGAKLLRQTGLYNQIFGVNRGINLADFNKSKTMGEFVFGLTRAAVDNPAEFFKTNLKGDLDTYNELRALQLGKNFKGERKTIFDMYKIYPKSIETNIFGQEFTNAVEYMKSHNIPFSLKDVPVNGNDLMQFGLQGKQIGDTFVDVLNKIYKEELPNEREAILNYVKSR